MTFYEIAEKQFIQHTSSIRRENFDKSLHEGGADLSTYDKNKENFEQAKQGRSLFNVADFRYWIFHPSETKRVIVEYTIESRKEQMEVNIKWAESNGEIDEENHTYPDDIERVYFIKDEEVFWV